MKTGISRTGISLVAILASLAAASPAFAQLGAIRKGLDRAEQAKKIADMNISDQEERELGEQVSARLRSDFGVYQDAAVTKYVSLVGTVLAQASSRPNLNWQFIVLDTDGVNAFAAPGGIIHITRGALGLIKNEAELAGVLAHEITHVTAKHTVRAIQKGKAVELTADQAGGSGARGYVIAELSKRAYEAVLENAFDRGEEEESDKVGVQLANKVGYAPEALSGVLARIAERNKDQKEPNGMFASHPRIKDRMATIAKAVKDGKLSATATAAARYGKRINLPPAKPIAELATVAPGARGLTGTPAAEPAKDTKTAEKKDEPKKAGGLLGKFGVSKGSQAQNTQTVASAGARGVRPDRDAVGGDNPKIVPVTLTAAEIAEFKKGIV